MPPADAPAESDAAPPEPAHVPGDQGATAAPSAKGTEDTLDLKLTEELQALIGEDRERAAATGRGPAGEL
ncbi:N-acetyltransferase, partial [Streptomyces sp. SID8455]|nr:N-acetyltransferase [Streptomyces sp. SID8455]